MSNHKKLIIGQFESAGIQVNGPNPFDIKINNEKFYEAVITKGTLGIGESYMDGWWDCEDIAEFINRNIRSKWIKHQKKTIGLYLFYAKAKIFNFQNIARAFQVGIKHYDINNEMYQVMLGKTMSYTCAYWKTANTLDEAQEAKFELICKKLDLKEGMHVLELGCGWGSFAYYAAKHYGVKVTGMTISKEQVSLGNEICKGLPVTLKLEDYRSAEGEYDRVLSIGIMEHIGYKNYIEYMKISRRCLKKDGIALVHTIGNNRSTSFGDPWLHKYIFPNFQIPSLSQLGLSIERNFVMEDWHNIGPDYDKTLLAWDNNLKDYWSTIIKKYGEKFARMWKYYLMCSAGSFRARKVQLWQLVLTRKGREQPECRII